MQRIIDSHLHFWDLEQGDYHWLSLNNPPHWPDKDTLRRSFSAQDLKLDKDFELSGIVHIEAGFNNLEPMAEVHWLQREVEPNLTVPMKIVAGGDISLEPAKFFEQLAMLSTCESVVGIRHILDQSAVSILKMQHARTNLEQLAEANLLFETQLYGNDVEALDLLAEIALALPKLTIVIDHFGFLFSTGLNNWHEIRVFLEKISGCKNIFIKASGWEMHDSHCRKWEIEDVTRLISTFLEHVSSDRLIFASNFPLCLLSDHYSVFWQKMTSMDFSDELLEKCVYENPQKLYFQN